MNFNLYTVRRKSGKEMTDIQLVLVNEGWDNKQSIRLSKNGIRFVEFGNIKN
jgi:hypothetical protein